MENDRPTNHIRELQDQLRDSMVKKIERYFHGARMSILLDDVANENNIHTDRFHPETVRALCHYLSVLVGEATDTAILFVPESKSVWVEDGYDSREEIVENEFIVVPRSRPHEFKRRPTRENLSEYDILRRIQRDKR